MAHKGQRVGMARKKRHYMGGVSDRHMVDIAKPKAHFPPKHSAGAHMGTGTKHRKEKGY